MELHARLDENRKHKIIRMHIRELNKEEKAVKLMYTNKKFKNIIKITKKTILH